MFWCYCSSSESTRLPLGLARLLRRLARLLLLLLLSITPGSVIDVCQAAAGRRFWQTFLAVDMWLSILRCRHAVYQQDVDCITVFGRGGTMGQANVYALTPYSIEEVGGPMYQWHRKQRPDGNRWRDKHIIRLR